MQRNETKTVKPGAKALGLLFFSAILVLSMSNTVKPSFYPEWWNLSWNHRVMIEINSTAFDRTRWPVDFEMNFTQVLGQSGVAGTFDNNSVRVFEYDYSGNMLQEVPSQFEPGSGYNSSVNAFGFVVFIINGTTTADTNRSFYVYYDITENGAKAVPNYATGLSTIWDGQLINATSPLFEFHIDTNRSENTSGIYRVKKGVINILDVLADQRTAEYNEYFGNGANLTFDLRGNASFFSGPVRTVITQYGPEIEWGNLSNQTGEVMITKKYYIYNHTGSEQQGGWIKIRHELENTAGYDVYRSSTVAGAIVFDVERSFGGGSGVSSIQNNETEPSYSSAIGNVGEFAGVFNLNKSVGAGFSASNTSKSRVGLNLSNTTISSGGSIFSEMVAYLGNGGGLAGTEFLDIVDRFKAPISITQRAPESLSIRANISTDHLIYNRNETMVLRLNATQDYDPYNLISLVNVTLDMGTAGTGDDQIVELFDDGNHSDLASGDSIFGVTFNVSDTHTTGQWNASFSTYDSAGAFLNQSSWLFNITDAYVVNVTVLTKYRLISEQTNATIHVSNYREDSNITNSSGTLNITCYYNQTLITQPNITNQGNGNYFYQFNSPGTTGDYNLNCTASGNNNTGLSVDTFFVQYPFTFISINTTVPVYNSSQVTQDDNETITINITLNNTGNATAQAVNITLDPASGWNHTPSVQSCGIVNREALCQTQFNLTVPNTTVPGSYNVNVTVEWLNPNSSVSSNQTQFNVSVLSNPLINVSTDQIAGQVAEGYEMNAGNFTIFSKGNDDLVNVTFNATGLENFTFEFIPPNVTSLPVGNSQDVQINVSVPLFYAPGTYNGTINISSKDSNYKLIGINITVPPVTNVSFNTTVPYYLSTQVTRAAGENFTLAFNITNTGNATARYVNVTLDMVSGWSYAPSTQSCGSINISSQCSTQFNVTIPNATEPASFYINATVEWYNPDSSVMNLSIENFNITVMSNPVVNASPESLSIIVGDGAYNTTGNFTLYSMGNDNITLLTFNVTGLPNFSFVFTPVNISNLTTGNSTQAFVNVSASLHTPPGIYNGTINASYPNGFDTINLSLTVPANLTWIMDKTFCQRAESPDEGVACIVTLNNTGNTEMNFTITPQSANYTQVNNTNFTLFSGGSARINVTYNVSGVSKIFYDAYYFINTSQKDSNPPNRTLHISLVPFIEPIISVSFSKTHIPQANTVNISINVTDRSYTGINTTTINITTPDNVSYFFVLSKTSETGNLSTYGLVFPNVSYGETNFTNETGNTSTIGIYNVSVFSEDNSPYQANRTEKTNFTVYTNLIPITAAISDSYYQNSHGWVACNVTDFNDKPVQGVNVTITLRDSLDRVIFNNSYRTNSDGWVFPMPEFSIAADAVLGTYNITSEAEYMDEIADYVAENSTESAFTVTSAVMGGIEADIETNVMWYPESNMTFVITIYDASTYTPLEPDGMDLIVYAGSPLFKNVYLRSNLSDERMQLINFSNVTNSSVGPYYTLTYVMPANTASGDYWARLDAAKGVYSTTEWESFKVTRGGPYDVEVTPIEDEVYREDYFDFEIFLINMGDVGQDVDVEYWVTSADNDTWYYKNFTVFTPAAGNITLTRSAYIYSSQPYGQHVIHVKVTYDTILPSITTSATFQVVQKPVTPTPPEPPAPPGPGPGPAPTPTVPPSAELLITDYPSDIGVVRGWEDIRYVKVKNVGETLIDNVTLVLTGVPSPWYEVKPAISGELEPGNETVFVLVFSIPVNAMTGEYIASIVASAGRAADEKEFKLSVFKSQHELVENELKLVNEEYTKTLQETNLAEKYGKEVTEVRNILKEARIHIDRAETEFNAESYTEAMTYISTAWELIRRAQEELGETEYRPEMLTRGIPLSWLWLILIGFVVLNVVIFVWRKKAYKKLDLMEDLLKVRDIIKTVKREAPAGIERKAGMEEKKRKLSKVMDLLESEMKEGLITEKTYQELKKRTQKKMKKLK